jgi:hypothetical protein
LEIYLELQKNRKEPPCKGYFHDRCSRGLARCSCLIAQLRLPLSRFKPPDRIAYGKKFAASARANQAFMAWLTGAES